MTMKSAGILLFRIKNDIPEVLLVHPGGPLWQNKDKGIWSVPKGEFDSEDPLEAAKREFTEELGISIDGNFIELGTLKQKSGKLVFAWALKGDFDTAKTKSNFFNLEWPPKSGIIKQYPEIDRAEWFT